MGRGACSRSSLPAGQAADPAKTHRPRPWCQLTFRDRLCRSEETTDVHYYRAGKYAVHHYRSETGWRFALLTNEDAPDCSPLLRQMYCDIFVPLVIRNPLADSSEPIALPLFDHEVDQLLLRSGATLSLPRPTAAAASVASSQV